MNLRKREYRKVFEIGLLASFVLLMLIHLNLTWSLRKDTHMLRLFGISLIYWMFGLFFLYENKNEIKFQSTIYEKTLGSSILFLALYKRATLSIVGLLHLHYDLIIPFVQPFFSVLGICLFVFGWKQWKNYWQLLLLFSILAIPLRNFLLENTPISTITTIYSSFILGILGYDVSHYENHIVLPHVHLVVEYSCTGVDSIVILFQILIIILLGYSLNWQKKIFLILSSILIPIFINGFRVVIMGIILEYNDQKSFESFGYWHDGYGSKLFYWAILLAFGLCSLFALKKGDFKNSEKNFSE